MGRGILGLLRRLFGRAKPAMAAAPLANSEPVACGPRPVTWHAWAAEHDRVGAVAADPAAATTPLQLPAWAAWASEPVAASESDMIESAAPIRLPAVKRPLSAQLAAQARLNVPKSRKAAARGSTDTGVKPKRQAAPRSVHLQARHLAPKRVPAAPLRKPVLAHVSPVNAVQPSGFDRAA